MSWPRKARVRIKQYADFSALWSWVADGLGVDFTGCTAAFDLRSTSDGSVLASVSTTPSSQGSIVLGTPTGALGVGFVQLNIAKAQTALLTVPVGHGDLLITFAGGYPTIPFMEVDAEILLGRTY